MQDGIAFFENVATETGGKTLLQLLAPANRSVEILEASISFAGTSAAAVPIDVQILREDDAGSSRAALVAGTNLNKLNDSLAEALTVTGTLDNAGDDPTAGDIIYVSHIHPQAGLIWRPPTPLFIGGGDRIGLFVNAAADINASGYFIFRE